jgi:hypothetical protein
MRTRFLVGCLLPALLLAPAGCTKSAEGNGVASVNGSAAPSPTPSLSLFERLRRHAQCMREHDVPEPDPEVQPDGSARRGRYDKNSVDREVLARAVEACKPYEVTLSDYGASGQGKLAEMGEYARCMRSHGVADFPDPDPAGRFQLPPEQTDPDYEQAKATCDAQSRERMASQGATR